MSTIGEVISILKDRVGEPWVVTDPDKIGAFEIPGKQPAVLVYPADRKELADIVALAARKKLVVIPCGNGTKLSAGNDLTQADILLSTIRMKAYVDYDLANLSISVEGGLTLKEVQEKLGQEGRGFALALDPPYTSRATLGGIVATNDSGPRRFLYGTARDNILGLKAVFPDGREVAAGGKTVKNVAGYDMTKLLIGSWGTLGVITEITFKILPLPEEQASLLFSFAELNGAAALVRRIVSSSYYPAALDLAAGRAAVKLGVGATPYLLAVALEGVREGVARQRRDLERMGKDLGATDTRFVTGDEHVDFWLSARDLATCLQDDYPELMILKANFLISRYAELQAACEGFLKDRKIEGCFYGHGGSGILYIYLLLEKGRKEDGRSLVELIDRMSNEAQRHEGNLVVRKAPPWLKSGLASWGKERNDYPLMARIKKEIDPDGIFNRGRFVAGI